MRDYCDHFRGKKITLMGLGLLGRGVGVAKFLAECEAELTVTDLKDARALAPSLARLKKYPNIRYVLGRHRPEDFRNADMVIKAAGVPLDSPFVAEARESGVPVKMDASLFAELVPEGVTLIGVTGTRGKSTTTQLIFETLTRAVGQMSNVKCQMSKRPRVFLAGNVRGVATLPLLAKVRPGDFIVLELDSWQLQGFGEAKMSPHVAVFTTFYDDHLNYYKGDRERYLLDKAQIFLNQVTSTFVVGEQATRVVRQRFPEHAKRMIVARASGVPKTWKLALPGEHNRYNAACALAVADVLGVPRQISRRAIESFRGLPGRLELVRTYRGIKIYNDTCATTPEATIAALRALSGHRPQRQRSKVQGRLSRHTMLIMGGADKGLDMSGLLKEIPKYCKAVVLLAGTGTDVLLQNTQYPIHNIKPPATDLRAALQQALHCADVGGSILFSPSFASFGMFKNEYDRGEKFVRIVKMLRTSNLKR